MAKGESKKSLLEQWLAQNSPDVIDEPTWHKLRDLLAPVSDSYLRKLLRETGSPLAPLVEGVAQDCRENLERTLLALEAEYMKGGTERAKLCRAAVITAKDHAKFALRRLEEDDPKRADKKEMLLWMMTWLENPGLFSAWLNLRKRAGARMDAGPNSY